MDEAQIIPIKNFRIHLTEYAELATNGQTFIVVKRSKPLFKIIPIKDTPTTKEKEIKDFLSYAGLLSDIDEEKWIKNIRKNRKLNTRKLPSIS